MGKLRPPGGKRKALSALPRKAALSPAHKAVLDAWFANGCTSKRRALLAVGYAEATAGGNPHQVFGRPDVIAEIDRRRAAMASKTDLTEAMIIAEYRKLAFASMGDLIEVNEDGSAYLDFNLLNSDQKAAMAEYTVETYEEGSAMEQTRDGETSQVMLTVKKSRVKFHSKLAALDSLSRIMGMFKDKIEVSGAANLVEKVAAARARIAAAKVKP